MKIEETIRGKRMIALASGLLLAIAPTHCAKSAAEIEDADASRTDAAVPSDDAASEVKKDAVAPEDAEVLPDTGPQILGGVRWTLSRARTDALGSLSLVDAVTKSGQVYFNSYVQGVVPGQLSNGNYLSIRVSVQVPSTSKTPINIPAGTYPCATGSVEDGTTYVQVKIDDFDGTEFTSWTSPSCTVEFTQDAVRGGVFMGRFSGMALSPLTGTKIPFDGTFRVRAPK